MPLTYPICSQLLVRMGNEDFRVSSAEMQGFRPEMEDHVSMILQLANKRHPRGLGFFGVFDGHGGDKASCFLKTNLPEYIANLDNPLDTQQIERAVLAADEKFLQSEKHVHGSTAVFAVVAPSAHPSEAKTKEWIVALANVGDSRAFIIRKDGSFEALTRIHRPTMPEEKSRIEHAEGFVTRGRVDGSLAMSRAFGDSRFKRDSSKDVLEQKVISLPEVRKTRASEGDMLLLCCDGVLEALRSADVTHFIWRARQHNREDPAKILSQLLLYSLRAGSLDNQSCVLVSFENGSGYTRKDEYLPGPYRCWAPHPDFSQAYLQNAARYGHGRTKDAKTQLLKMADISESNMPDICKHFSADTKQEDLTSRERPAA